MRLSPKPSKKVLCRYIRGGVIVRGSIKKGLATFSVLALFVGCAGKDEQLEDPISAGGDFSEDGFDYFGEEFTPEDSIPMGLDDSQNDFLSDSDTFAEEDPYASFDNNPIDASSDYSLSDVDDAGMSQDDFGDYASESLPMADEAPLSYDSAPSSTMPAATPSYSSPSYAKGSGRYVVQPGDTLAHISRRVYGDSSRWRELAASNNIANPRRIFPGDVIKFDTADTYASSYASKMESRYLTVQVQRGDTLSSISARVFGTVKAWKYLWRFNEDKISNPNMIRVGQTLRYMKFDRNGREIAGEARRGQSPSH